MVKLTESDKSYMEMVSLLTKLTDDNKTGVGALIVKNNTIISHGVNVLPNGAKKTKERTESPLKRSWIIHAERDAIYKAAKAGISLDGSYMYCTYFPCVDCARGIVQSGIKRLYAPKPDFNHKRWGVSWVESIIMMRECGVEVIWTNEVV
tara:strand:- start:19 stop:468 length:450 start_codon:yes stop_codon:yes gene_type:complete